MKKNKLMTASLKIVRPAAVLILVLSAIVPARAGILFQNDDYATIQSTNLVLNSDDEDTADMAIKFGNTVNKEFKWDITNSRFSMDADLDLSNYQLSTARIENVNALPGGALGLGSGGIGRIVQLTVSDTVAPGCTVNPWCQPGAYTWTGTIWNMLDMPAGGHTQNTDVGTTQNTFTLDLDDTGGDVTLQFGTTLAEYLKWNSVGSYFSISDKLKVEGNVDVDGTNIILDADNTGAPTAVSIIANQGTNPPGVIRFNASKATWELSNDNSRFMNIGFGDNTESNNRVIAGLKIIQENMPSMSDSTLQNEVGVYQINGVEYIKADNQTITIPAASASPRWDSIEIDTTGNIGVYSGTPSATPSFPDVGANRIRLGLVYVPASPATPEVFNANIMDFATTTNSIPVGTNLNYVITLATGTTADIRVGDTVRIYDTTGAFGTGKITVITNTTTFTVDSITGPIAAGAIVTAMMRNSYVMDARGDVSLESNSSAAGGNPTNKFVGYGGTWVDLNGLKWDSLDRPLQNWRDANDTCLSAGGLMAPTGQLYTHRSGGIPLPNITTNPLWVDAPVRANSVLNVDLSTGNIIANVNMNNTRYFRCVSAF